VIVGKRKLFSSSQTKNPSFRTDIAGLRGAAVLMVTLCHFGIPGFSGGFIGPDIFFVLSGYLITGILYREFTKKKGGSRRSRRISFKNFYSRRARRILPASIAVIIAVNVYARLVLTPGEIARITADTKWSLLFGANINFMRQATDYFAQSLSVSPLQHYWSLSVEEQFYFVWPILLLWAASFKKLKFGSTRVSLERRLVFSFTGIAFISFCWMLFEFTTNPTASYFSTFSRTWELALGGLLSLISAQKVASIFGSALPILRGVAVVGLFGSLAIVSPTNFGYTLIIPTLATGFLLVSAASTLPQDAVYRLMSFRVLTAIGTISYSVYLWHWPIAVFGRQQGVFTNVWQNVLGVGISLLFGMAGYYLIERPFLRIDWRNIASMSRTRKRKSKAVAKISKLQQSSLFTGLAFVTISMMLAGAFYIQTYSGSSDAVAWVPPASAQLFAPNVSQNGQASLGKVKPTLGLVEILEKKWLEKVKAGLTYKELPPNLDPRFSKVSDLAHWGGWTPCAGKRYEGATFSSVCESVPVQSKNVKTAILLGDSHMRIFWEAITASLDLNKWHIILLGMSACPVPPVDPNRHTNNPKNCDLHRELTFKYVEKIKPDLLFMSDVREYHATKEEFISKYKVLLSRLGTPAKKMVLFETSPVTSPLMTCVKGVKDLSGCPPLQYNIDVLRKAQRDLAREYGIGYWAPSDALCVSDKGKLMCPPVIGNLATSGDGNHIFPAVSKGLAPSLMKVLIKMNIPDLASI